MILESMLSNQHSLIFVIIAAYATGVLASLTPCIYPMIPITLGIITAQQSRSMLMNFFLSLSYGIGIATVYATLGYLSATTNIIFGQWLAHPLFIAAMITLFLYLAFSMFGFYDMYVPRILSAQSNRSHKGGSLSYSFMFGLLSGAAASPCLTPALALLLGYTAKQGNPFVGFVVLFAFALGVSTFLIVVGTFSSSLSLLPRAGTWMEMVKKIFGFLLLAVCVSFVQPLVEPATASFLYAIVVLSAALYYLHLSKKNKKLSLALVTIGGFLLLVTLLLCANGILQMQNLSLLEWIEGTLYS